MATSLPAESRAPSPSPSSPFGSYTAAPLGDATRSVSRLDSVDLLRGIIMVIMVLDHVRDYFTDARFDPTDLTQTSPALFLTRWITHFCAPVFVFLSGTGAFLSLARGKPKAELSRFLVTRGIWLIILELTLVQTGLSFTVDRSFMWTQVIWALGWSMIVLAALIHLPVRAIAAFGITMIALHNLLDGINPAAFGTLRPLWMVLHQPGTIQLAPNWTWFTLYPLIPWIGVMAAGYAFGAILLLEKERRNRILLRLGLSLAGAFIVIRLTNIYGDAQRWSAQKDAVFTVLSFLNVTKYPPSLLFLLMTLGPAIALLRALDREPNAVTRPFIVFGRVPLFFYLLQFPLAHALAIGVAHLRGEPTEWLYQTPVFNYPPGYHGFGLAGVYFWWVVTALLLYPLCAWYAEYKRRHPEKRWLSYL